MLFRKIKIFLEMIKFEHSIFALPFAYLGLLLAHTVTVTEKGNSHIGSTFFWVTICMVSLRTAGMAINRLLDQSIDAQNPRTRQRALPAGLLTRQFTWIISVISLVIFVLSAAKLNPLCLALSPIPIILVWIYPLMKRYTWASHWVLGITLGLAPYGGWLAARPEWSWVPGILSIAVTAWVAGFDVFYSLQDLEFDRRVGLKSLSSRFGAGKAIFIAKFSQGLTVLAFILLGMIVPLGIFYWISVFVVSLLIYREHQLVNQHDLSRLNEAFFNMNAWVSVVIFAGALIDILVHHA